MKELLPVLEKVVAEREAASHHRRGRRGRGARHAGGEQAPRHAQGGRGEGARLRRPPQGDAARHRGAHRRAGDLRRDRLQAGERGVDRPGPRQADRGGQGQHHGRGRQGQARRHPGPDQRDPGRDREDHERLRSREAPGAAGQARREAWRSSTSAPRPRPS